MSGSQTTILLLLLLPLVGASMVTTMTTAMTTKTPPGGVACALARNRTARQRRLQLIRTSFGQDLERLDLAFVIDHSESIGQYEFNETKSFIRRLLSFLSRRLQVRLDGLRSRISAISFGTGAMSEFDGISNDDGAIDTCALADHVSQLHRNSSYEKASEIPEALAKAKRILAGSRHKNPDVTQILWIFFDGHDGELLWKDGRSSVQWADDLKRNDVIIFAVGIGSWLNTNQNRVDRVVELATSPDHYACIENWEKILNQAPPPGKNEHVDGSVYGRAVPATNSTCGDCPRGLVCACNVLDVIYECTDPPVIHPKPPIPVVMVLTIAIPIIIIIIIVVVVIVFVVIRKRKQNHSESPNRLSVETRPTVPSNMSSRYSNHAFQSADEAIADQVLEDYPDWADYEDVIDTLEHDMPGWSEYLFRMKNENRLTHIGIRCTKRERWAFTPGFKLTEDASKNLKKIMEDNFRKKPQKIKLAAKTYIIDVYNEEVSENHLHAIRKNRKDIKESAWIAKASSYIIVGLADETEDRECGDVVYKIFRQLDTGKPTDA